MRSFQFCAFMWVGLALNASPLPAQVACELPVPSATDSVPFNVSLLPIDRNGLPAARLTVDQRMLLSDVARAIADGLREAPHAPLDAMGAGTRFVGIDSLRPFLVPDLSTEVVLTIGSSGTVTGMLLEQRSTSTGADSALMHVLRTISQGTLFSTAASAFGNAPFRLAVFTSTHRTPPRARDPWVQVAAGRRALPVFAGTLATLRPKQAGPSTEGLRSAIGDRADMLMRYIVAPDGTTDRRTIRVLQTTHATLAERFVAWAASVAYEPARIGSCPVASVVRSPMRFFVMPG